MGTRNEGLVEGLVRERAIREDDDVSQMAELFDLAERSLTYDPKEIVSSNVRRATSFRPMRVLLHLLERQRTSREPGSADNVYTELHLLLLQVIARVLHVATSKNLLSMGAPLVSKVENQAPMTLHAAVFATAVLSYQVSSFWSEFHVRMARIEHLVNVLKLDVNGVCDGNRSALIRSKVHCSRPKSSRKDIRGGILRIANFLISNGASIEFALSFTDEQSCSTPLGCLRYADPGSFQAAIDFWQPDYPKPIKFQLNESIQLVKIPTNGTLDKSELSTLPQELLSLIWSPLELVDLKNVRLTSRSFEISVVDHFRPFIRRLHVNLTTSSLCDIIQKLQHNRLACYIEEIMFSSSEDMACDDIVALLEKLFKIAFTSNDRSSLFISSASRFECIAILCALYASKLQLHSLSLYQDTEIDILPAKYFEEFPDLMILGSTLSSVRELKWSLPIQENQVAKRIATINLVLSMMPQVEVLKLYWYTWETTWKPELNSFDSCFDPILAMKLKECTLKGLCFEESNLSQFLAKTSATRVTLDHVYIMSGTYETGFAMLCNGKFDHFYLDSLQQRLTWGYKRFYYGASGEHRFRITHGKNLGLHENSRDKEAKRSWSRFTSRKLKGVTRGEYQEHLGNVCKRWGFLEPYPERYCLTGWHHSVENGFT